MLLCAKRANVEFYFRWDGKITFNEDLLDFLKEFSVDVELTNQDDKVRIIGKTELGEKEFSLDLPKDRVVYLIYSDFYDEFKIVEPIVFHSKYMQLGEE